MTNINGPWMESGEIPDDANVLITISTSEMEGMIRRWGVIAHAIGDLSVEALVRGAVDDGVLDALRQQRPQQYDSEKGIAARVKSILDSGYRLFVHHSDDPIDSARAGEIRARSLLATGSPEYKTSSFCVLHLTVEPFGSAVVASHRDEDGAAAAGEALRRDMSSNADAQPPVAAAAASPQKDDNDDTTAAISGGPTAGGYHPGDGDDKGLQPAMAVDEAPAGAAESRLEPEHAAASAAVANDSDVELVDEQIVAEEPSAPTASAEPPTKKNATKADALMEQFHPKVQALDFRGLFVGNFGFQRDTVVDVAKLTALNPQTISAYLMKANALRQSGEHEKALSYYRVLLKSDADNADYRFLYGKTLREMGRLQPARECFERARELGHENAARELEQLDNQESKKPTLGFLQFWRRATTAR